ncbi:MAG: TetR/AcrR family transcriptional regulator [Cyclobacteriaceae bacterium]
MASLKLDLNPSLYLKNPQDTKLGEQIVGQGVIMIDELGFEQFTFKKLATKIGTTEATVYRYFENKHSFLVYIVAWYWNWLDYKINFVTHYLKDSNEKLAIAVKTLCRKKVNDPQFPMVDESILFNVVINESDKTFLTKEVDQINKKGVFIGFKELCEKLVSWVLDVNPEYPYPKSLCSTVIQATHDQLFFANHFSRLSDFIDHKNPSDGINAFIVSFLFKSIKP